MCGMDERPEQRPEGALIAAALKRSRMSQRRAAAKAGISENRLRAIMHGYQNVGAGSYIAVRGPADTVARIAHVVGVGPERLEEAGRRDAAEELRLIEAEEGPHRSGEAHITGNVELSGSGRPSSPADEIGELLREIKDLARRAARLEAERRETDAARRDEEAG
jgi:transcriptional regulator with XRE-family HTH domain